MRCVFEKVREALRERLEFFGDAVLRGNWQ